MDFDLLKRMLMENPGTPLMLLGLVFILFGIFVHPALFVVGVAVWCVGGWLEYRHD